MTLYFTAKLGQWNAADGSFQLQTPGVATTLKPQDLETRAPYYDGAVVELWRDGTRQAINHFQASLATPQCASTDGSKIYKFNRMSQWWVVFGDADEGVARSEERRVGKECVVRVDIGGRRSIKKKK